MAMAELVRVGLGGRHRWSPLSVMDATIDRWMGFGGLLMGGSRFRGRNETIVVGRITGMRACNGQLSITIWGLRAVLAVSFCGELGSIWAIYENHGLNLRGCSGKRRY